LETLLKPSTWLELSFFASVIPDGDVLPVRALYGDSGNTNIGLNPLTCKEPIWYAGPDLAGSKLKTGRAPTIVRAFRLVPGGVQAGMLATRIGSRTIDPVKDDFFRAVIEERKTLKKTHPHHLLLKIIANALYGIFAELNKVEYGKNRQQQISVFSGDYKFEQSTFTVERPGKWQFAPAAALITAGGRLMLAILERMIEDQGGTYLLTDTDSMFFVASKKGGLIPCPGGLHKMPDGSPAVKAVSHQQVTELCTKFKRLNLYDPTVVPEMLKIEDCNYDLAGNQHQLYGLAVSAKRYVVHNRHKKKLQIIKLSEHGLGVVFVPDERKRYKPENCKDQDNDYPRWIAEAWEFLLNEHSQELDNPEDALVRQELWFADLPAMMRIRVTTPNVLKALRIHDRAAAKPYNFAQSPILVNAPSNCSLISTFNKHSEKWLKQDYVETHSGEIVKLNRKYRGKEIRSQTLGAVLWRHYLHAEDKSLSPEGQPCGPYTRGLLSRRPIEAMMPPVFIGKEIDRKAQEGEDITVLEDARPIRYEPQQTRTTRAGDAGLIMRAQRLPFRKLMRTAKVSQHALERFLHCERVHSGTRVRILKGIEKLERESRRSSLRKKQVSTNAI